MSLKTRPFPPFRGTLDGPVLLIAIVHSLRRFSRVWLLESTNIKLGWCWPPFQMGRHIFRLDPPSQNHGEVHP